MGVKAKLSTKVLSFFLSVLMAVSCFGIVVPSLSPAASAANVAEEQWAALKDALAAAANGGYLSTDGYAVTTDDSTGNTTVNDTTKNGYIYAVVRAVGEIAASGADDLPAHNTALAAYIAEKAEANTFQTEFIAQILPAVGNYAQWDGNATNGVWNGDAADLNLEGSTFTTTVTRDAKGAVLTDYESAYDVPAEVDVKYTVTFASEVVEGESAVVPGGKSAYYKNASITTATEKGAAADVTGIRDYLTFVNDAGLFGDGFAAWTEDPYSVYNEAPDVLETRYNTYIAKKAAALACDADYVEKYIGAALMNSHTAYANACLADSKAVALKVYVDWINGVLTPDVAALEGYMHRNDYTDTDVQRMTYLRGKAQAYLAAVNAAGDATKELLGDAYGYNAVYNLTADTAPVPGKTYYTLSQTVSQNEAGEDVVKDTYTATPATAENIAGLYEMVSYEAYIADLTAKIELWNLADIKAAAQALMNTDASHTYTFPANSRFSTYALTSDTAPVEGKTYYEKDAYGLYVPAAATEENIASLYEASGMELMCVGNGNYKSETYVTAGSTCPVDDLSLEDAHSFFQNANAYINTCSAANVEKAGITAEVKASMVQMEAALWEEIGYRMYAADEANANMRTFRTEYDYFVNLMLNTDVAMLSNDAMIGGYVTADGTTAQGLIAGANQHWNALNNANNALTSANANVKARYNAFVQKCYQYVNSMYQTLVQRSFDEYNALYVAAGSRGDGAAINGANFSLVKGMVANLDDDRETDGVQNKLLTWLNSNKSTVVARAGGNSNNMITHATNVNSAIPAYLAKANEISAQHWNGYARYYNDHVSYSGGATGTSGSITSRNGNNTGIYTVRDGRADDMVRADNDKDYVVTEARINTVIQKLDTFAASTDLVKLIGQYDESRGITSLKTFINNLLIENLFSDDMVNTFVTLLFPMLSDLLQNKLVGMLIENMGSYGVSAGPAGYDARLNLNALIMSLINSGQVDAVMSSRGGNWAAGYEGTVYLNTLQGNVDIALNGHQGTQQFEPLFSSLGIKIFPNSLSAYLKSVNSSFFKKLTDRLDACGDNWMNLDANHDGTVDKDDFASLGIKYGTNGVHNYNDFIGAMGGILGAAGPLLNAIFTNHTYTASGLNRLVYVYMNDVRLDLKGKAWFTFASPTLSETVYVDSTSAYGNGYLQINGMLCYNDLWVPIMEMLGITGYTTSRNVTSYSQPLSNSLGNSGSAASTSEIVNGMFFPLMALIDKVANKPIDTVLGLLPNLAYNVAYDNITVLMNCLQTALHIEATVDLDIGDIGIKNFWFNTWDLELGWLADLFRGKIEDLINGFLKFDIDLDIGNMIDLPSKLPFDVTNLNDILKYVLGKMNEDTISTEATANVPAINAGHLGGLGGRTTLSSVRSSGHVAKGKDGYDMQPAYYISADKADVLYEVIQLVMDFVSKSGNLSGLLASFGSSGLGSELEAILGGIDAEKSLAALVELFVPQTYKMSPYNWYQPNTASSTYTFNPSLYAGTMAQGGFVYLKYSNQWTREKAQYMYDNLENAIDDVFGMIDSDMLNGYTGFSDWLLKTINKMFRNEGVTGFLDILMKLVSNLDSEGKMLPNMLKDQLKVSGAGNVDIYNWYYRFGYLYPEFRTLGTHEITEVDENGNVSTKTVGEVLYQDKNGNVCVGYPESQKIKVDGSERTVTVMNFVRTYPLAPAGFAGFTTDENGDQVPAKSGSNLPGRTNQANITYRYSPVYSGFSSKRYDNYAAVNISADGLWNTANVTVNGATVTNKNRGGHLFTAITPVILDEADDEGNYINWQITGNANTAAFGVASGNTYTLVDGEMGTETTAVNPNVSARAIFTAIFAELIEPLSPALSFILNGNDLNLFNSALTVKGYDVYNGALVPLLEASGITDLLTSEQYKAQYNNNATGGFYYLANKIFVKLTDILTDDSATGGRTPTQKIIDLLPGLFYYLQSDGLGTLLKNALFPIWVLVDDIRPLVDVNLDLIIHGLAGKLLGVETDTGSGTANAVYNLLMGLLDIEPVMTTTLSDTTKLVNAINEVSLKNLKLKDIANLVGEFTGMNLQPLFYAFEGMCYGYTYKGTQYGVKLINGSKHYDIATFNGNGSKVYNKNYTLTYLGPDVVTVTISAVLDLLRYGDNAKALDDLIGLARELLPGETQATAITATGLLDGLEKVFAARANDSYAAPNWDYLLEGKLVKDPNTGNQIVWTANTDWRTLLQYSNLSALDLHNKHDEVTKRALGYKTDWTRDTAVSMDTMFTTLLDWLTVSFLAKDDASITGFEDFANSLINEKLLGADTLKTLAGLIATMYNYLPASVIGVVDNLLQTNLAAWQTKDYIRAGDPTKAILDENGNPAKDDDGNDLYEEADKFYVNDAFKWWATEAGVQLDDNGNPVLDDNGQPIETQVPAGEDYVDTRDEFFDAITEIITPVSSLFGFLFLEDGYKFFYTAGDKLATSATNTQVDTSDDTDAINLEGLGIWGKGLIPLLEALGIRKIMEDAGKNFDDYGPSHYTTDEPGKYNSEQFVADFIMILRTFAEGIIADPVEWLLNNLPNIIYFINAGGVSTAVKNIFDSVQDIIDMINTQMDASDRIATTNLAGINLSNLTLDGIFKLLQKFTAWEDADGNAHPGLYIRDDLVQYIKDLYFGELTHYVSANGRDAFRMDPLPTDGEDADKAREDRANLITVFVALVLEIAEDQGTFLDPDNGYASTEYDNPAVIDALVGTDGLVKQVIEAVKNPQDLVKYKNVDWFYFSDTINIDNVTVDGEQKVEVPGYLFVYLNYTTKWTYDKALATATGLEDMALSILKFVDEDKFGSIEGLGELINVDTFYNGELLQNLLDMLANVLYGEDALIPTELLNVAGALLDADLTQWNRTYAFSSDVATTGTDETGLAYGEVDGVKTYLVNDRDSFIAGVTLMLRPAYRLLDWLLFGDSYEFFNGNTAATENDVLITLPGSNGYARGLVLLLEALGCEGLKYPSFYEKEDGVDTAAYMSDILTSVANRIDAVCADPVNEIVGLIYFINAGGLQTVVENLLAGPLALVNNLQALAGDEADENDPNAVVNKLVGDALDKALEDMLKNEDKSIHFNLDGINLQYIFEVVEAITGLEITDCVGNKLDKFYMGEVYRYNSMSGEGDVAYKMIFSNEEDFADFITIMASLVIDVLLWEDDEKGVNNAEALAELLPLEDNEVFTADEMKALIIEVVEFLKNNDFLTDDPRAIDWLYFDENASIYDANDELKDPLPEITETTTVNTPDRFINYLTYASDWSDDLAHYIYNNRNELISSVLKMANLEDTEVLGITLKDIFSNGGAVDLLDNVYTAKNLNAILKAIQGLTEKVPAALFDLLYIVLDIDFSAYDENSANFIGFFDEETNDGVLTRDAFVDGLVKIVKPIGSVIDWLLFGTKLQYFDKKDYSDGSIDVLLEINGANGYKYGLIPILEALGINAPACTTVSNMATMLKPICEALLGRVEEILANPVDEILALLPNLLYFINSRGLIASVQNLLAGPMALLDKVNEKLDPDGTHPEKRVGINTVLKAVGFGEESDVDIMKLDLLAIFKLVEDLTGTKIVSENGFIDASKIENFYFGEIVLSKSANGKVRGTMRYTDEEDAADMLTILVNFVIEFALHTWEETDPETGDTVTKSNAAALEALLGLDEGTVTGILEALDTLADEAIPGNYHWNYFNEVDDSFDNSEGYTEAFYFRPKDKNLFMNYLTYDVGQKWTQTTADYLYQNLGSVLDKILTATGNKTVSDIIKGSFDLYTGENLDAIVGYIDMAYDYLGDLIDLVGLVLGADLTGWKDMTKFADLKDEDGNPLINDKDSFRTGLIEIVKPLYPVLDWLLFGKDYGFFVKDADGNTAPAGTVDGERQDGELIKLNGANGYAYALVPLLTILGVDLPACEVGKTTCGTEVDGYTFLDRVVDAVLTRVDEILANPVDEALALLPQLIYFINANGAATLVENLLGSVLKAADVLVKNGTLKLEGEYAEDYEAGLKDFVFEKAGIDISNLDLEGILAFVEGLDALKGLKINEVFTREDLNADGVKDNILEYFYMGSGAERVTTSVKNADGTDYCIYKLRLNDTDAAHPYVGGDVLTTLLSIVLEVVMYENDLGTANAQPIADLVNSFVEGVDLTAEKVETLRSILKDGVADPEMGEINWSYVYGEMTDEERAAKVAAMLSLDVNALNALPERTVNYLTYDAKNNQYMHNLWSEDAVKFVDENLNDIVDRVINMVTKGESEDLNALIKNNLDIFSDDIANKLVGYIVNALGKLDNLLGGDTETTDSLLDAVGTLLGVENLSSIRTAKAEGIESKEDFVDFLVDTLGMLNPVLDWLLFGGESYKFFTKLDDGKPHTIQLKGGNGYKYGLAPILDALGVDTTISEEKSETALREILTNVANRVDEILQNPIDEVLALLPELIYFINADGLTVCANNLIAPIDALLKAVGKEIGQEDLSLNKLIKAVDLDNLNFNLVYSILADKTGIILNDEAGEPIGKYLSTFYFGELKTVTIYDDLKGFHMEYTDRDARYDMVTIIVTLVLDVIVYSGNKNAIIDLLKNVDENKAEGIYNAVVALLTHNEKSVDMVPYNWILTEYDVNGDGPEAGKILTPVTLGATLNHSIYGPLYTRPMGEYITKFFPLFVDTWITLLGIEGKNGDIYRSLDDLLEGLIGTTIYKTELVQSIADALSNAIDNLRDLLGEELFNYVVKVLDDSLDVDLEKLEDYVVTSFAEGDRNAFVNAISEMLDPAAPILRWLLTDQAISLFTNRDGEDYIVLNGAKGYKDSIIPIMEALHVPADSILTQDEYEAATAEDDAALLSNIINPILDRVDEILENPIDELLDVLPALAYFINSKGLDSAFKNLLNAVLQLLETIDPVIADVDQLHKNGKVSLYPLMGQYDLEELDFDGIANILMEILNKQVEDYGFELTGTLDSALTELTVGIVRSFGSKRGETDYTMDSAGAGGSDGTAGDKVDLATVVMRIVLNFISKPANVIAIEKLLQPRVNEDGFKFISSLLENFQQYASTEDGMDKIMYTVYQIFYAALTAGVATNNGLARFNGDYSFLNQLFGTSQYSFFNSLEKAFGDLLNKWTGDVVDDDEVVPKGFIKFFQSLIDFFKKILQFFKNLFGG